MALALLWTLALGQATLQLHDSTGTGTIEFEPTAFATLSGDVNGINVTVPVSGANFLLAGAATSADPGKASLAGLIHAVESALAPMQGGAHGTNGGEVDSGSGEAGSGSGEAGSGSGEAGSGLMGAPSPTMSADRTLFDKLSMLVAKASKADALEARVAPLEARVAELEKFLFANYEQLTLPDSVTSFRQVSYPQSLTSVTIPNSVTSIGNIAF